MLRLVVVMFGFSYSMLFQSLGSKGAFHRRLMRCILR